MSNYDRIYTIVRQIPWGKVATYGQIADLARLYGKARLVGYALFRVQIEDDIPWHRVINAQGQISYSLQRQGGDYLQKVLLEEEGIEFKSNGKIDLNKYRWRPSFNSVGKPSYTLEELLEGATPDLQHEEVDWGESVGEEIG
ncbi:MAG: hypothetical protein RLZZ381_1185 [Cyanobacteriota bacterium]|jgi:methylated-DNA-protein-cysteine methyltransferase related protein